MSRPALLLLIFPLLLTPAMAFAECPKFPDDIRQIAKFSAMVFSGTVTRIESITGAKWRGFERVTFDVDRVWKGSPNKQFVIYNFHNASVVDVGFPLQRGIRYVVFADRQTTEQRAEFGLPARGPATFSLGGCGGGTRMYEDAKTEIPKLGPGRPPAMK